MSEMSKSVTEITRIFLILLPVLMFCDCGQEGEKGSKKDDKKVETISFKALDKTFLARQNSPLTPKPFLDKAPTPSLQLELKGHSEQVKGLCFTPDGSMIVSGGFGDYTLRLWDVLKGNQLQSVKLEHRISDVAITPDGTTIVTADVYQNIIFWPLTNGKIGQPSPLENKVGMNPRIAISSNGKILAVATFDKKLTLLDFDKRLTLCEINTPMELHTVSFDPSGTLVAVAGSGNKFIILDLSKGSGELQEVAKVDPKSYCYSLSFSHDGKFLATGHNESTMSIWNVQSRKEIQNWFVSGVSCFGMAWSPDGKVLATLQPGRGLTLWTQESASFISKLSAGKNNFTRMAFSPQGDKFAAADETIYVWWK